ncbi:hypothetical protein [Moraxella marmotae]
MKQFIVFVSMGFAITVHAESRIDACEQIHAAGYYVTSVHPA